MMVIDCPNCGARNQSEFKYGGEGVKRPDPTATQQDYTNYLYFRDNPLGTIREWWYHRAGCGHWFMVERHTLTHEIQRVITTAELREGK